MEFGDLDLFSDDQALNEQEEQECNKENLHIDYAHAIDVSKYGIVIQEDASPGCGGLVWASADVLISHLFSLTADLSKEWHGKRIIELGSGTGAVGIALAKRYVDGDGRLPFSLCLTDLDFICPIIERNLELNGLSQLDQVQVKPLKWGTDNGSIEADVVLISDCVYLESCFDPLLDTLKSLIRHPSTICLMSYKKRRKAEKRFFIKLKKSFRVEKVDIAELVGDRHRDRLILFSISL